MRALALTLAMGFGVAAPGIAAAAEPLRFGVFPYLSAVRLETIYAPVSKELAGAVGRPVKFLTSSNFQTFFQKLGQQRYDIALIQPFWYPPAVDRFDYLPLARMREPLTSVVTVLADSPLREARDLVGKTIATPPAFVPVVHMARAALTAQGVTPDTDVTLAAFKTVDSCFQQVLIGVASACVAPSFAPPTIAEKLNVRLRVLVESEPIPNLSFVVHPRVPAGEREKLRAALLSWTPRGASGALLEGMRTGGLIPPVDGDYDVVRVMLREIEARKKQP